MATAQQQHTYWNTMFGGYVEVAKVKLSADQLDAAQLALDNAAMVEKKYLNSATGMYPDGSGVTDAERLATIAAVQNVIGKRALELKHSVNPNRPAIKWGGHAVVAAGISIFLWRKTLRAYFSKRTEGFDD